ncbi:MAG: hypothetical protein ACJAY8_001232 [Sphingobacteriales bacterium]|jgi:hypothetical protein
MDNLRNDFGKFLFPGFLALAGLTLFVFGLVSGQSGLFSVAGFVLLLMGGVSLLYAMDKVSFKLQMGMFGIMITLAAIFTYLDFAAVKSDIDFANQKKKVYHKVIQGLKDVRTAQLAFKDQYGVYCPEMDSLVDFVKNGTMTIIRAEGMVPDTLTEVEALAMGIITRDTLAVSVEENVFGKQKVDDRVFPFVADSMAFASVSRAPFVMKSGRLDKGGVVVSVFEIIDSKPFDPTDVLKVGSLKEASTSGNWKGE